MITRCDHLTKIYGKPNGWTLESYERDVAGYQTARRVLGGMTREQVVEEAKKANIRGRGGAGFPMGVKWSFMRPHPTKPAVPRGQRGRGGARDPQGPDDHGAEPHSVIEGASSPASASARTSRTSTCATSSISRRRG